MTGGKRIAWIVAALIGAAIAAAVALRAAPEPPEPASAATVAPEVAPPVEQAEEADAPVRSTLASDQLDAKQRSELEVVDRLATELKLSDAERAGVVAAIKKLQAGRQAQFARLVDGSAGEEEVTAGLHTLHLAFETDIQRALGAPRAADFTAGFNAAYGVTFRKKKKAD